MKNFYLGLLVFSCSLSASAQFSGAYAPANWTTVLSAFSNGSVNTSGAPASIIINGSNDASNTISVAPVTTDYTIVASTAGPWKFSWTYHTNDTGGDPQYDPAGILIDGVFTQITNDKGGPNQSGTFIAPSVTAGTTIGFSVIATDNAFGNATLTISGFAAPGSTLPVTLVSFTARPQAQGVLLQWKTADERNLSGFTVERSADGIRFSPLATLPARNLQEAQTYEATDAAPLAGTAYYRLRIKEQGGEDKFSLVVPVKRDDNFRLQVYPNPVKDRLNMTVSADREEETKLELLDAGGRTLRTKIFHLQAGRQTLGMDNLPTTKGIYYLRLKDTVIPFIKE